MLKPAISIKTLLLVFGVGHTSLVSGVHIISLGPGVASHGLGLQSSRLGQVPQSERSAVLRPGCEKRQVLGSRGAPGITLGFP